MLPESTDPERQPLLPAPSPPASVTVPAKYSRLREDQLALRKNTRFSKLYEQYTDHTFNLGLTRRVAWKIVYNLCAISANATLGIGIAMVNKEISDWLLGTSQPMDSPGNNESIETLREIVPHVATQLIEQIRTGQEPAFGRLGVQHVAAVFLLKWMSTNQGRSGEGTNFAIAQQLVQAMGTAILRAVQLVREYEPTLDEDLKAVYNKLRSDNKTLLKEMKKNDPEHYKRVKPLLNQLWNSLVKPINFGIGVTQTFMARELLEAFDMQCLMYRKKNEKATDIWLYNDKTSEGKAKREVFNARIDELIAKFVPDSKDAQALRTFIDRVRITRASGYEPGIVDYGTGRFPIVLILGPSGAGKSEFAKALLALLDIHGDAFDFHTLVGLLDTAGDRRPVSGSISPFTGLAPYIPLMMRGKYDAIVCDEADLICMGNQGMGLNQAKLDRVKRALDPTSKREVVIRGQPENADYVIDLSTAPVILTSNLKVEELDPAIARRISVVTISGIPLKERRMKARAYVDDWMRNRDSLFAMNDIQIRSLKNDMGRCMEYIVKESELDAGPQNMQLAIQDLLMRLAMRYVRGEQAIDESSLSTDLLEGKEDAKKGWSWVEVDPADIPLYIKDIIRSSFDSRRPGSDYANAIARVRQRLEEANSLAAPIYFSSDDLYKEAEKVKLNPKDTINFVTEALQLQWDKPIRSKPRDIQRCVQVLTDTIQTYLCMVGDNRDAGKSLPFKGIRKIFDFLDALMHIPVRFKNLSHWEVGGDRLGREQTWHDVEECAKLFSGSENQSAVRMVLQNYENSTFPLRNVDGRPAKSLTKTNTLFLVGPAGAGKDFAAKAIAERLGLSLAPHTVKEYCDLMRSGLRLGPKGPSGYGANDDSKSEIMEHPLGSLRDLLKGEEKAAALFLSGAELSLLSEAEQYELNSLLAPDANDPVMKTAWHADATFQVELPRMLKIVTMRTMPPKDVFSNAVVVTMSKPTIDVLRLVATSTYKGWEATLQQYDFDRGIKHRIFSSCREMLPYVVQRCFTLEAAPAMLNAVIDDLFSCAMHKAKEDSFRHEGKKPEHAAEHAESGEDSHGAEAPASEESLEDLDWKAVGENLPQELIDAVNATFDRVRAKDEDNKKRETILQAHKPMLPSGFPPPPGAPLHVGIPPPLPMRPTVAPRAPVVTTSAPVAARPPASTGKDAAESSIATLQEVWKDLNTDERARLKKLIDEVMDGPTKTKTKTKTKTETETETAKE